MKNHYTTEPESERAVLVTWKEQYATGIKLIDEQHQELVNLTNKLYQACLEGQEMVEAVFKEAMSRMVNYVRFHFNAEQQLLEQIKYPQYLDHKKQHETLVKDILEAVRDYETGKKFVPNNFVRTLTDWVFGHIAIYDKRYAEYAAELKARGLLTGL
jgi:hemerythrin